MKLNIKKKYIILWCVIIIAIIIFPDIKMYYQQYKLRSEKLPEKFLSYSTLDNLKDHDYEVLKIYGGFNEPVLQGNDSTIIIISGSRKESKDGGDDIVNKWYKINLNGQITDSLQYSYKSLNSTHSYQTFNDYIVDVDQNTYSNWIKDGDTIHYPYKNITDNKIFSVSEAQKIIADKEYMYDDIIHSDTTDNDYKYKLVVFKDNVWNYFYTEKSWTDYPTYKTNKKSIQYDTSTYTIDTQANLIKRDYVHKEKWAARSFWNLNNFSWGSGNGSGGDGWTGTSYFSIKMPKKMLHYKQHVSIDYPDGNLRDPFSYFIYQPKNGAYLLLIDTQNQVYYLIRPRK